VETRDWLPTAKSPVGVTQAANCPDIPDRRHDPPVFELRGISVQELLQN